MSGRRQSLDFIQCVGVWVCVELTRLHFKLGGGGGDTNYCAQKTNSSFLV